MNQEEIDEKRELCQEFDEELDACMAEDAEGCPYYAECQVEEPDPDEEEETDDNENKED